MVILNPLTFKFLTLPQLLPQLDLVGKGKMSKSHPKVSSNNFSCDLSFNFEQDFAESEIF